VPFPFEYKRSQEIKPFESSDVISMIENELKKRKIKPEKIDSEIRFDLYSGIFRIRFRSIIRIDIQNDETTIHYTVNLNGLVRLILYVIIICIVLSVKSIELFLITSIVFSVLLYFTNLIEIIYKINRIISPYIKSDKKIELSIDQISKLQEEWMKDKERCPACGSNLSIFDTQCPNCDLKLREYKDVPINHTKEKGVNIRYFFKKI
jgi:hypothetical protein